MCNNYLAYFHYFMQDVKESIKQIYFLIVTCQCIYKLMKALSYLYLNQVQEFRLLVLMLPGECANKNAFQKKNY